MTYLFILLVAMNIFGFQWGVISSSLNAHKVIKIFGKTIENSNRLRHSNGRVIRLAFSRSASALNA